MTKGQSLQDPFLNNLRLSKVNVSIFLVNGIKLQGQIDAFDQFVILLKNPTSQLVYKHAISTIVPEKDVSESGKDAKKAAVKSTVKDKFNWNNDDYKYNK